MQLKKKYCKTNKEYYKFYDKIKNKGIKNVKVTFTKSKILITYLEEV
jgi:hypothetical protein